MEYLKLGVEIAKFISNIGLFIYLYLMIKEYVNKNKNPLRLDITLSTHELTRILSQRELSDDDVLRLEHIIKTHNEH